MTPHMTPQPTTMQLAETAYRAYGDYTGWVNHAGNPMPAWRELPKAQREAWVAAVAAVRRTVECEGRQ